MISSDPAARYSYMSADLMQCLHIRRVANVVSKPVPIISFL